MFCGTAIRGEAKKTFLMTGGKPKVMSPTDFPTITKHRICIIFQHRESELSTGKNPSSVYNANVASSRMSDYQPSQETQAIPENLKRLLDEYRRKLWRAKIIEAILAGILGLLLSFLLVFALDRFIQTSAVLRLCILLGGTSLFAVFAPYWMRRWVWGHRRENELARLIAAKHPDLGDRLLGIIELQEQTEAKESLSPRLRHAAMETVAADAEKQGLSSALPGNWIKKALLATIVLSAAAVAAFMFAPKAGINALQRWAMPLQETERYTFTKLEHIPNTLVVPHGEAFSFIVQLADDSEWRPDKGQVRYGALPPISADLKEKVYAFTLPAQHIPGKLNLSIGDARHTIRIEPTLRPTIDFANAEIVFPSYLERGNETIDLKTGVATVVEGSKLAVTLNASRNLASASLGPITHVVNPEAEPGKTPKPNFTESLSIEKSTATTSALPVAQSSYDIPFAWTDEFGLEGDSTFKLRVEAIKDTPPSAYIQGIERQIVILPEETIEFDALAEDDFGLKELGIEWYGEASNTATPSGLAKGEMKLMPGSPADRRLANKTAFCPATQKITPQKLILRAYTLDYLPKRGRVYSEPITLFILTRDEHAQMLKNQFDRVVGELEDATRREQNAYEENQRLERLAPEELQKEENRKRIEAQQKAEQENKQRIEDLEKRMEQLLKDSARNGDIDKESMKKMAETMKSLGELSKQDMPKVEGKLSDAQQQNNTPEQSKKDVEKAVEEQKKVVEKMQKALEKARDANKNMEASTFVNRLKRAATEEDAIAAALIEKSQLAAGMPATKVDPSVLSVLQEVDIKQANNASDIRWLQEDLGHFFTRTNKEVYRDILDEMRKGNIDSSLEELRELMRLNHTFRSANAATYWAKELRAWAKKLEGEKDENGGGNGGGGDSPNPEDEDFEFMLRVMKLIQSEQDLRASTRALEEMKRSAKLQNQP
jgi:hypothetical protein